MITSPEPGTTVRKRDTPRWQVMRRLKEPAIKGPSRSRHAAPLNAGASRCPSWREARWCHTINLSKIHLRPPTPEVRKPSRRPRRCRQWTQDGRHSQVSRPSLPRPAEPSPERYLVEVTLATEGPEWGPEGRFGSTGSTVVFLARHPMKMKHGRCCIVRVCRVCPQRQ